MSEPKTISLSQAPKGLVIEWSDGHQGIYPFPYLRQCCPCALCKGERTPFDLKPLELPTLKNLPPTAFDARQMFKVGLYAIGFKWGDGHDSGIYTFDYLRKTCPCEKCLGT
jgi:DUF971 family protein